MIWFLIWLGIVVFSFQGMFTGFMAPASASGWFFTGLCWIFLMFVATEICGVIAIGVGETFDSKPIEGDHYKLNAIRDKDGIEGHFFLGSGFSQSEPYYFYYYEDRNGGLKPSKLNANDAVTVYQEDRADAEMIEFNWKITYPNWAWLICITHDESQKTTYAFHVPKGTIKAGYSM